MSPILSRLFRTSTRVRRSGFSSAADLLAGGQFPSRVLYLAPLLAIMLMSVGCVPQDRYDQLLMSNRSLQEQLSAVESERDTARGNLDTVRRQLTRATENINELQAENSRLNRDLTGLAQDYDSLLRRVSDLEIGPLPEEVESAIQELAARYPDVLTFDARRGLLRFASDFTFDLGSVELKPDAVATLQQLARILNSEAARELEARIVGHTDNVPIRRAETLRHHPTNMHLSVHRAISVRDRLVNDGVDSVRIQVAGYGPYRPVVPHRTGGTPENRRVEVFLVPMPPDIRPTASPAMEEQPRERAPEPMK
jgi:chemotaxis protein MotB